MDERLKILWRHVRKPYVLAALIGVAMLSVAVGIIFLNRDNGPFPPSITKKVEFQLYYPSRLPTGFSVDKESFSFKDGVAIFTIRTPYNRSVSVSQQAAPADAPVQQSLAPGAPVQIPGERSFPTNIGQGHIGLWGENYVADITTEETWIIINVTGLTADQAMPLAQSFRKAD